MISTIVNDIPKEVPILKYSRVCFGLVQQRSTCNNVGGHGYQELLKTQVQCISATPGRVAHCLCITKMEGLG